MREYAHDLLESGGRLDDARRAHARHFGEVFEDAESGLESATMGEWLDRMDADRDNVRAAIAFAAADGDAAVALVFCAAAWRYWIWRGSLIEGRELVTAALACGDGPPALRQRALNGAGAVVASWATSRARRSCWRRASSSRASSTTATAPRAWAPTSAPSPCSPPTSTRRSPTTRSRSPTCARSTTRARSAWSCRTSASRTTAPATTSRRSSC